MTIIMGIWNFFILIYLSLVNFMWLWILSLLLYAAIWISLSVYHDEPKSKPKNGKRQHHFWKNLWQNFSSQTKKNIKILNYIYLGLSIIGLTAVIAIGDMAIPLGNYRNESQQEKQKVNHDEEELQKSQYANMHKYLKQQAQNPDLPKFEQNWYQQLLKTQTDNYLH